MDRDPPEPQIFDPAQSPTPFLPDVPPGGGLVVLVVASAAAARDWAERTAVALAAGWAEKKRRILLADLALAHPGLHQVLGIENGEGMSDAFLFGSSVLRVARPVRERGFLFVPAGTATASPEAVAASPRWASVVDACDRISATVVVFLPSDLPGGEHLLAQASDVFLLTDASAESGRALPAGMGDRLRGVLVPPLEAGPAAQGEAPEAVDEFDFLEAEPSVLAESATLDEPVDASSVPKSAADVLSGLDLDPVFQEAEVEDTPSVDAVRAPEPDAPSDPDPISDEAIPTLAASPVSPESQPAASSAAVSAPRVGASRSRVLVLLFLVALIALVAAAWYGVVEIPWVSSRLFAPDTVAAQEPVALPAGGGEEVAYFADLLVSKGFPDARPVERNSRSPE